MRRHKCGRQSGLTLMELLVTIVIAGIAFAALVPVVVQALQAGQGDRARALALSVAQDRLEKVRELGYEELETSKLQSSTFHFGMFGTTTNGVDGTTDKEFTVAYTVTPITVSETDARIAYKTVTVTVDWIGPPYPHKSVTLSTVVYRQSAGPRLIDARLDSTKLAANKMDIAMTPIRVTYVVDEADLPTMEPKTFGVPPNDRKVQGRVEISVSPGQTFTVPYDAPDLTGDRPAGTVGRTGNEFYVYWASSAGGNGAGDGYYSFSARAFSTNGYVGEASTLIGSMKVETGPPAPVDNLFGDGSGTAGNDDGVVNLTWTASTATDLEHYLVYRTGPDGVRTLWHGDPAVEPGWRPTGTSDSGLTFGATYLYEVVAVDWVDNPSTIASVSVPIINASGVAPSAPNDLKADLSGTSVTLTWAESPSVTVAGYKVYMNDGVSTTDIGLLPAGATMTMSHPQGAGTIRYYTVKAYRVASPDSAAAAVFAGYPTGVVGGETWARIQTPAVVSYDVEAKVNSVAPSYNTLKNLELWYLGPAGLSVAQKIGDTQVTAPQAPVFTVASADWKGQPAGVYQFRWVYYKTQNGNTSALTTKNFTCSGAIGPNTAAPAAIP